MALTEYYVDPSIAADSGAGTVGDPYGDLQYALNTVTRDSTNGDRFNIKAGTDEILGAALSLATYGTPTNAAPIVFQGYTSAQGDGGIGAISGNGSYTIMADSALDYVQFIDLKLHNTGSNYVIDLDNYIFLLNCEITNSTAGGITVDAQSTILNCYVHNVAGSGIDTLTFCTIRYCYIKNGTNDVVDAITPGSGNTICHNIINIDGTSDGIHNGGNNCTIFNNSIYANGGSGVGIRLTGGGYAHSVFNNIIEGFSSSGTGVLTDSGQDIDFMVGNRYYNNNTNESISGQRTYFADNSALGASPFTNPGGDDFSVGTGVKAEGYPSSFYGSSTNQYLDTGAAQRQEPAGTGSGAVRILPLLGNIG